MSLYCAEHGHCEMGICLVEGPCECCQTVEFEMGDPMLPWANALLVAAFTLLAVVVLVGVVAWIG